MCKWSESIAVYQDVVWFVDLSWYIIYLNCYCANENYEVFLSVKLKKLYAVLSIRNVFDLKGCVCWFSNSHGLLYAFECTVLVRPEKYKSDYDILCHHWGLNARMRPTVDWRKDLRLECQHVAVQGNYFVRGRFTYIQCVKNIGLHVHQTTLMIDDWVQY